MEPGSDQFEQRAIYEAKRYRVLLYSQERLEYSTHSGVIASLLVKNRRNHQDTAALPFTFYGSDEPFDNLFVSEYD
ncbi:MAG: hypothetical protein KBF64_04695 [Anaerolineaceae bacterium]|nr:hypothetical protein [Anaerolineaceae bacterium]